MKKVLFIFALCYLHVTNNCYSQNYCSSSSDAGLNGGSIDCYEAANGNYTIPVYFHRYFNIVTENGSIPDLNSLLDEVNTIFSTNGFNINLVLAKYDEEGECFDGYKLHNVSPNTLYTGIWSE